MHIITQKQQRGVEGTDTVGLWPPPATPLSPRSLAWPQGPPLSRTPGSPGRRPPPHLPVHGRGLRRGASAGAEPAAGHSRSGTVASVPTAVPPTPQAAGAAVCVGPGPGGAGAGSGLQAPGGEGSARGVGRRWGQSCRWGLVLHLALHLGGHWDLEGTRVQCGLVTLTWVPPATVLARPVCQSPGPLVSGRAGSLLQARWPSSPRPHLQRMSWSPTRTPRPSFCRARASRWTWRWTVWMPAPTSTSSTCATSCGAYGASPALAGGPPHLRALRYTELPSVALVLTTGWTRGLAEGPGEEAGVAGGLAPSHQGRSLVPELALSCPGPELSLP